MLYTLTMHPAVDLFFTPALRSDAAVRAGGKGVNVSRFLRALGRPSRCIVLCGGARGRFLCASLAEEGLDVLPVDDPDGLCRINLKCTGAQELALDGRGPGLRRGRGTRPWPAGRPAAPRRPAGRLRLAARRAQTPAFTPQPSASRAIRARRASSIPPERRCACRWTPRRRCCAATAQKRPPFPTPPTRAGPRGRPSRGARRRRWSRTARTARISAHRARSSIRPRAKRPRARPSARATR